MKYHNISSAFLNVTNACNCRCRYCFETHHPETMSIQTAIDAANFLIRNAEDDGVTPSITFFGGEPMLCWDTVIVPVTEYVRKEYRKPFFLSITSNCTLMTEERLRYLKDNGVSLLFSVDGAKETQDYNRPLASGESCFDKIKDIIDLIPKYFPSVTFRSTAIPETCSHLFENIMFAEEHGYSRFYVVPNTLGVWDNASRTIMSQEMRKYSDYYIDRFRSGVTPIQFSEFDKALAKISRINAAIIDGEYRKESVCGSCAKCGLGVNRYGAIDYRGNVYGCQELVTDMDAANIFCIGNIYDGVDAEKRIKLSGSFDKDARSGDDCKSCRLDRICDGGCVANNYIVSGNVNIVTPVYCWWMNLLLDEAIYVCNEMGETPPEAFMKKWKEIHNVR